MANEQQVPAAVRVVDIHQMDDTEIAALLRRVGYGHLGCTKENRPYIIPIHYVYDPPELYIYTTRGMKTDFIASNPQVCLQVEEVVDARNWKSAIAAGVAELLTDSGAREQATKILTLINPTLSPAIGRTTMGDGVRESVVEIYRIRVQTLSGRKTRQASD
jgi:nitroimidazol reductase NimA-like FMN-containing flavoprotein (pyridoxamine 5'-phosphate oxidase superfamily)